MAENKGYTVIGYAFPNVPSRWGREERDFALALRRLFDDLYTRTRGLSPYYDKDNYEKLRNLPEIEGQKLTGSLELGDIGIHDVTDEEHGLMIPEDKTKLDGIEEGADKTTVDDALSSSSENPVQNKVIYGALCRPELDYLSMMAGIQIPTDTENKKTKLAGYYNGGRWNELMIWNAVDKWITAADYEDIIGQPFPPLHD